MQFANNHFEHKRVETSEAQQHHNTPRQPGQQQKLPS
jgi:hypothetical protein